MWNRAEQVGFEGQQHKDAEKCLENLDLNESIQKKHVQGSDLQREKERQMFLREPQSGQTHPWTASFRSGTQMLSSPQSRRI